MDKKRLGLRLVGACLIVIAIGSGLAGCAEFKAVGQPQPTADALATLLQEKQTALAETTQTQPAPLPPTEPPVQGILDGIAPPFNTDVFWSGGNQWNGYINNVFTIVYAGARGNDHQQGVVVVVTETSEEWFDTPAKAGPVRIVAEKNNRLTLQPVGAKGAAPGTTAFYFDVPGRQFASSLTEIVPTAVISFSVTPSAPTVPSSPTPAQAYP